jgi:hypothetical protein
MIAGIKKYRKEGIDEQNRGNYAIAIERYKQARGEARASFASEFPQRHHLIHGLMAEVSTNIAECIIEDLLDQYEASQKSLNECLSILKEIVTELNETQISLKKQIESMKDAYRGNHASIKTSNKELTETLQKVKRQFREAKITIYWNEAVARIRIIDEKFNTLEEKVESFKKNEKTKADKKTLSEELKSELMQTIDLLQSALGTAKKLRDGSKEAVEIKDLMVNLYETNGDIFSLMESDAAFYPVKQEYLNFMLEQYGNAFHIAHAQRNASKEDVLPLYFSVLNVLEDKAKQLDKIKEFMDDNEKSRLIDACVKTINFIKKYPLAQFADQMTVHEKLELQSYLFTAHHLLSKHYVVKVDASKSRTWHEREQVKRQKAHEERALEEADKYCKLAQGVEFEKESPLYQVLLKIRYHLSKKTLMNTLHELAHHALFSQDTASLCTFMLSLIHGEIKDKKIFSLFGITRENGGLKSVNTHVAMELFIESIRLCRDQRLKMHELEKLKKFIETNKLFLARVGLENTNSALYVKDERARAQIKHCLKSPQVNGSTDELTTILYTTVKQNALGIEEDKISKDETKTRLFTIVDDYFANLDTLFSKEQIIQAFPKLLKEMGEFLKTNKYSCEVCSLFDSAAKKLDPMIGGEIKLWKETPVENPIVARKTLLMQMKASPLSTRALRVTTMNGASASSPHIARPAQTDLGTRGTKSKRSTLG